MERNQDANWGMGVEDMIKRILKWNGNLEGIQQSLNDDGCATKLL